MSVDMRVSADVRDGESYFSFTLLLLHCNTRNAAHPRHLAIFSTSTYVRDNNKNK